MESKRDNNRVTTLLGVDNVLFTTPTTVAVDPTTHAMAVDATVTATIDKTGLATDTNQTDGSQKTQVVDAGGEAVTVTGGKLDVNASIDTTGLATSAKQLPDGHNVTIDNSTGAAAVNIQDGGNSITVDGGVTVTNSTAANLKAEVVGTGTFATQATLAAETTKVIGTVNVAASQTIAVTNAGTFATQATLQTGSNAIGKLAANSGVDIGDVDILSIAAGDNNIGNVDIASAIPAGTNNIGDVDVLTIPRSLSGPGQPGTAIDSYSHAAISAAANTANQSLVAAPGANKQIWVYGISYVVGTAAGSVSFQDEDDTAISGVMPHALNSGMAVPPSGNFSMPIWKLATNKALEVDTVTCDIKGWLSYAIVSV